MSDCEITYHVQGLTVLDLGDHEISYWEEHTLVDSARLKDDWREPRDAREAFLLKRTLEGMPGYYEGLRVVRITRLEEVLTFNPEAV